jgi:hypothetical protein
MTRTNEQKNDERDNSRQTNHATPSAGFHLHVWLASRDPKVSPFISTGLQPVSAWATDQEPVLTVSRFRSSFDTGLKPRVNEGSQLRAFESSLSIDLSSGKSL